ncbi:MAG: hypothetical protein AAGI25_07380 [Bacteroidota bacterium]
MIKDGTMPIIKIHLASFPCHSKVLNLNEINLIFAIKSIHERIIILMSTIVFEENGVKAKEVSIMALAGVGRPLKLSDWDSSVLNIANRSAEKIAIRSPSQKKFVLGSKRDTK